MIMALINWCLIRKRTIELLLLPAVSLLPLLGGCVSTVVPDMAETEIWDDHGRRIGAQLLQALETEDYQEFCKPLSPEIRSRLPESEFRKLLVGIKREAGRIQSYTFLVVLEQPLKRDCVWAVRFSKDVRQPDGRTVSVIRSRLFKLSLLKLKDSIQIANLGFAAI